MFNFKDVIKIITIAVIVAVIIPNYAFAAGADASNTCLGESGLFKILQCKAGAVLTGFRPVVYALGGFGIIAFAFAAIFGKINFGHLASIGIGLFLVSVMGSFISYIVGDYGVSLDFGNYLKDDYTAVTGSSDIGNDCMTNSSGACDESGANAKVAEGSNTSGSDSSTGTTVKNNADNATGSDSNSESSSENQENSELEELNDALNNNES